MMILRVFCFVAGGYVGCEGLANLWFWRHGGRRLFQVGRGLRVIAGFVLVALSILGEV